MVPEIEDKKGQRKQQVEGTDGVIGPDEQVAQETEEASEQADHRSVEHREPHVATGLVRVNVHE